MRCRAGRSPPGPRKMMHTSLSSGERRAPPCHRECSFSLAACSSELSYASRSVRALLPSIGAWCCGPAPLQRPFAQRWRVLLISGGWGAGCARGVGSRALALQPTAPLSTRRQHPRRSLRAHRRSAVAHPHRINMSGGVRGAAPRTASCCTREIALGR